MARVYYISDMYWSALSLILAVLLHVIGMTAFTTLPKVLLTTLLRVASGQHQAEHFTSTTHNARLLQHPASLLESITSRLNNFIRLAAGRAYIRVSDLVRR